MPLVFAPGEAFQFDWSEDWIRIGGKKVKLQMAHFKLCHSRAFFLRVYLTQTHEMLFDAHNHAFRVLQGIPERGIACCRTHPRLRVLMISTTGWRSDASRCGTRCCIRNRAVALWLRCSTMSVAH